MNNGERNENTRKRLDFIASLGVISPIVLARQFGISNEAADSWIRIQRRLRVLVKTGYGKYRLADNVRL